MHGMERFEFNPQNGKKKGGNPLLSQKITTLHPVRRPTA